MNKETLALIKLNGIDVYKDGLGVVLYHPPTGKVYNVVARQWVSENWRSRLGAKLVPGVDDVSTDRILLWVNHGCPLP